MEVSSVQPADSRWQHGVPSDGSTACGRRILMSECVVVQQAESSGQGGRV